MSVESIQAGKQLPNIAPEIINHERRPSKPKQTELWVLLAVVAVAFCAFLIAPMALVVIKSFQTGDGAATLSNYGAFIAQPEFLTSVLNSLKVAGASALVSVLLAFLLAYTVNCTNVPSGLKKAVCLLTQVPMLLPTITYGFAIIYSFGNQGLITRLFGTQLFDIYGFTGLMIGYVIYTLPTCFLLINNSFQFVDKKFIIVSHIMGDKPWTTFLNTILRPLVGTLAVAFIQAFFLAFTDYGIPTSVGGTYDVLAMTLYNQMLGSIPNFNRGAVIAVFMLIPSILSIILMTVLERYSIRYSKVSQVELPKGPVRDWLCGIGSVLTLACVLSLFAVILVIPFVNEWPFDTSFTLSHITALFTESELSSVYTNSLYVAVMTAIIGCLFAYAAGLVTSRSKLPNWAKRAVDSMSSVINTVPGMVLGIAFLFAFSGTAAADGQVVIYTNADDEAVTAFQNALNANGFENKYVIQSFGTSELGGKLLAEGRALEADLITMSSYYVDSAQERNHMFADLTDVKSQLLQDSENSTAPAYRRPTTVQEGAIFYNTTVLEDLGLPVPQSLADLADPVYAGQISVTDMEGSSTGWLMVQAPTDADVDAVYSHFEPKLLSILDRFADPKPGVIDAVAALREAGLKIGSTTGYTNAMMEIVVPKAAELGYAPDHWVSADGTQGFGRPYPYMIFHNMQVMQLMDVRRVAKVGDTVSDIKEGKNAGTFTIGCDRGQLADGPHAGRVRGPLPRRAGPRAPDGARGIPGRRCRLGHRHDGRAARPAAGLNAPITPAYASEARFSRRTISASACGSKPQLVRTVFGCVLSSPRDNTPSNPHAQRRVVASVRQHGICVSSAGSAQVFGEERLQLVEGDRVLAAAVIQVGVHSIRDDQQFLVVRVRVVLDHGGVGVAAEIAGMGLLTVHHQHRAADLVDVPQNRLVQERHASDHVPSAIGVQGTGMVAAWGLVIVVVILDEERGVIRKRVDHAAGQRICPTAVVRDALRVQRPLLLVTGVGGILRVEVTLGIDAGHVVHRGCHGRLDAGVQCGRVQRHAAPTADADGADAFRIHVLLHGQEVDGCLEVLGVDVR